MMNEKDWSMTRKDAEKLVMEAFNSNRTLLIKGKSIYPNMHEYAIAYDEDKSIAVTGAINRIIQLIADKDLVD